MSIKTAQTNGLAEKYVLAGSWLFLFLVTIFAYYPGLSGPFVFDDLGNLDSLGDLGGAIDWPTFREFVFGGHSGPTGRPLSLLTFLIDANNWPADPWPFKRTNLVIHLINGALLGVLIQRILDALEYDKKSARSIALVSAACWMLHPFLVSTTLYVVQRMAQLSTLFVLAGLIGFLHGRLMLSKNATRAYLVMTFSIGVFTLLAVLSKENGILLPLLAGVIEITVLQHQSTRLVSLNRRWQFVFITFPSLVIAGYLCQRAYTSNFFDVAAPRDFSLYERLLTQPRILFDYLQNWFIPKLYTTGVFQDHFIKSTGLLAPVTTVLSILLHTAIIGFTIIFRRRWPLVALALLFFYSAHLLESTVLNLELYFEHRNYLAACFLFVPVIAFLHKQVSPKAFILASLGVLLLLSGFTRYSATIWQDYSSMVWASAKKAPTSARAQAEYARDLFNADRYEESLLVIDTAIAVIPTVKPHLLINRLMMLCSLGILNDTELERVSKTLSNTIYDRRLTSLFGEFATGVIDGKCPDVSLVALRSMFSQMLTLSENADEKSARYAQIKYFIGYVELSSGDRASAKISFDDSLRATSNAAIAMNMAGLMASNRFFQEALYFSDKALTEIENSSQVAILVKGPSESDVRNFQSIVRADIDRQQEADISDLTP